MPESLSPLRRRAARLVLDLAAAAGAVALLAAAGRWLDANPTTIALAFVLGVLGVSVARGLRAGLAASVAAAAAFNFLFLVPHFTWTIADPRNWVAFATFLVTALVASRLVTSARRRADEAETRRREVESLYELSFGLFAAGPQPDPLPRFALLALGSLGASGGALLLGRSAEALARVHVSPDGFEPVAPTGLLQRALTSGEPVRATPAAPDGADLLVPLALGAQVVGALLVRGSSAPLPVVESVGRLLALAVDRERLLERSAAAAALAESDRLKTALLRAVSHDLRSPLTSLGLEIEGLARETAARAELAPRLTRLAREHARLSHRIDNLLAAARLEAGVVRPNPEPTPPGELFGRVRDGLAAVLDGRPVEVRCAEECPDVDVDPTLAVEILSNLIENAARVSPEGASIELSARAAGAGTVELEVADRGPGLPPALAARFDPRAPRGGAAELGGGLGLAIADSFARVSLGALALEPRPGGGTIARVRLPAAP